MASFADAVVFSVVNTILPERVLACFKESDERKASVYNAAASDTPSCGSYGEGATLASSRVTASSSSLNEDSSPASEQARLRKQVRSLGPAARDDTRLHVPGAKYTVNGSDVSRADQEDGLDPDVCRIKQDLAVNVKYQDVSPKAENAQVDEIREKLQSYREEKDKASQKAETLAKEVEALKATVNEREREVLELKSAKIVASKAPKAPEISPPNALAAETSPFGPSLRASPPVDLLPRIPTQNTMGSIGDYRRNQAELRETMERNHRPYMWDYGAPEQTIPHQAGTRMQGWNVESPAWAHGWQQDCDAAMKPASSAAKAAQDVEPSESGWRGSTPPLEVPWEVERMRLESTATFGDAQDSQRTVPYHSQFSGFEPSRETQEEQYWTETQGRHQGVPPMPTGFQETLAMALEEKEKIAHNQNRTNNLGDGLKRKLSKALKIMGNSAEHRDEANSLSDHPKSDVESHSLSQGRKTHRHFAATFLGRSA